jgi:hypothetical protein
MWRRYRLILAIFGLLAVVPPVAATALTGPGPHDWASGLPGCAPTRPAVAHYAGQHVLGSQPTNGPVPCGMKTGFPTVETRVEVTNDNAVIQEPALLTICPVAGGSGHIYGCGGKGEGLARTFNNGGKWSAVSVEVPPDLVVEEGGVDNNLYVDHNTGRFFFYLFGPHYVDMPGCLVPGVNPATIAFSDDHRTTWTWGFDMDHACSENPTVLTAKPRVSDLTQSSYPNVVYLCGDDTSTGAGGVGNPGFSCSKSLDGGGHWLGSIIQGTVLKGQGFYSGPVKDQRNPYPQCGSNSSSAGAGVQPLPDGTLVVVVTCGGNSYLSESKNEGKTWNIVGKTIGHGGNLRIDSAGNMYLLEKSSDNAQLLLSHSTNAGATWSPELNIVAPGVTSVGTYNFAQGTYAAGLVGDVAVTYYGIKPSSANGKKGYSDGFITATRGALAANPVFWSGQVNNPNRPLLYNTQTSGNIGLTILDFNGGAWAPNGNSVWGSWVQDCGLNLATSPTCTSRYPSINPADPEDGFAGRLVWPTSH